MPFTLYNTATGTFYFSPVPKLFLHFDEKNTLAFNNQRVKTAECEIS